MTTAEANRLIAAGAPVTARFYYRVNGVEKCATLNGRLSRNLTDTRTWDGTYRLTDHIKSWVTIIDDDYGMVIRNGGSVNVALRDVTPMKVAYYYLEARRPPYTGDDSRYDGRPEEVYGEYARRVWIDFRNAHRAAVRMEGAHREAGAAFILVNVASSDTPPPWDSLAPC